MDVDITCLTMIGADKEIYEEEVIEEDDEFEEIDDEESEEVETKVEDEDGEEEGVVFEFEFETPIGTVLIEEAEQEILLLIFGFTSYPRYLSLPKYEGGGLGTRGGSLKIFFLLNGVGGIGSG
jgi:hypothetical protein